MFKFGSRLLVSGLIDTVFRNIYFVIIGKLFTAGDLGFYTRARNLQRLPSENLAGSVGAVIFPVFSKVQDDPERLKRGMRKAITILAFLNFPIMAGLLVTARPLVTVLLTEKWVPCVPYLQLLCFVGMLYPVHVVNLNILKSMGRSDLFLRLEILKKILVVVSITVTYRWGIEAMIYGQICTSVLSYYLNSYYTGKMIGYPIVEQVLDMLPYICLSSLMGAAVFCLQMLPFAAEWSLLLCQVAAGIAIYTTLAWIFRLSAFNEIMNTLRDKLSLRVPKLSFLK